MSNKKLLKIGALLAGMLTAIVALTSIAYANPSYFGITVQTNIATSSPSTLIAGATSTILQYDALAPTTKSTQFVTNSGTLLIQFVGSTTSSVVTVVPEYSQDGIDWYSNGLPVPGFSTSTQTYSLNTIQSYTLTYASTTQTLGGSAQGAIQRRIIPVLTPVRFTRFVLSGTGATSTVWAQFVPVKEQQ